jgi:hypothetical protein
MKGLVFTEFLDFVEGRFGVDSVDRIIQDSELASGGSYTAVGTYDHREMVELLGNLGRQSGIPVSELLEAFGRHLFSQLASAYRRLFENISSAFDFLEHLEGYIHVEVRKLYPEAELPRFECQNSGPDRLVLVYQSGRGLADLAHGMILGCADHFGDPLEIEREDLSAGVGTHVRFTLTRQRSHP